MLKGIPAILSPELLKILCEMGHSDELVIGDGNFPSASHAQKLIRCDGHSTLALLDAILQLFPLDKYVAAPVALMEVVPGDSTSPVIWDEYRNIIQRYEPDIQIERMERSAFYERTKRCLCGGCYFRKGSLCQSHFKKGRSLN